MRWVSSQGVPILDSKSGFDSRHADRRPGGNKCWCVQASIPDTKFVQFQQLQTIMALEEWSSTETGNGIRGLVRFQVEPSKIVSAQAARLHVLLSALSTARVIPPRLCQQWSPEHDITTHKGSARTVAQNGSIPFAAYSHADVAQWG